MSALGAVGAGAARALLREPAWRRWVVAASSARAVGTMAPFALLLTGHWVTGSFAEGAYMAAAYALGAAAGAPFRGQALDRGPMPRGIVVGLLAQAVLLGTLAAAALLRAPSLLLVLLSLALGVVPAGVPGAFRALLSHVVPPEHLEAAFALDAVLLELLWIGGPLLVGGVAAVGPAVVALGVMLACALAGALLARALPAREPTPSGDSTRWPTAWRDPGVAGVLVLAVVLGVSWGAVDAGLPPRLEEVGSSASFWGVLAAILSATSAVGGLAYAGLAPPASGPRVRARAHLLLLLWGAPLLPVAWTDSPWVLAVWLGAAGLFLAPLNGVLTYLLQGALARERQVEGFSLYTACWALGMALGNGLAGLLLARRESRLVLLVGAAVPLLAALGATAALHRGSQKRH